MRSAVDSPGRFGGIYDRFEESQGWIAKFDLERMEDLFAHN